MLPPGSRVGYHNWAARPPYLIPFSRCQMAERWNPKYHDFANRPAGSGLDDENTGDQFKIQGADGQYRPLEWLKPPPTSHLDSFAYESKRPGSPYYNKLAKISGRSKLHVRFKPNGTKTKTTHYIYLFDDDARGERIFDQIKVAQHPGAEVVNEILIKEHIPYERLA